MTIAIWGWGSTTISTWGWGTSYNEYIPIILADFIESSAHICVLTRNYVDVILRETGEVVLRLKSSQIPNRGYGEILNRMNTGDLLVRYKPDELLDRSYIEVIQTLQEGDAIFRVRPDQIPDRERGAILNRISTNTIIERNPCLDE